ncbi:hypothetical protein TIFTF001_004805 [Ficus carica]|uniref:Uncharacterized protein n=1 Tax=Ficus carica TaxID=3494 RepID=A0AA87ZIR3_FICCA|nr:hypothetical protein TIFTF001_004805 [Ficus carica]
MAEVSNPNNGASNLHHHHHHHITGAIIRDFARAQRERRFRAPSAIHLHSVRIHDLHREKDLVTEEEAKIDASTKMKGPFVFPDLLTVEAQNWELIPLHREKCVTSVPHLNSATFNFTITPLTLQLIMPEAFNSATFTHKFNFTITPLSNSLSLYIIPLSPFSSPSPIR